jgi:hypothetical protein
MPENIVTFREDFPIQGSVPIADASKGFEAGAQALGDAAKVLGKKAESMAEEKSNFMLLDANNMAEDLKTSTKIAIKQNPDQAESILNSYNQTAASIKQNAYVNNTDRAKLDSLMNTDNNELRLTAAGETIRIQKRNADIKLWAGYPTAMKSIQQAIDSGDMDLAKSLSDNLVTNFKNAAYSDVATPQQFANVVNSVGMLYDRANELHKLAMNPNADAQQFHRLYPTPFDNDSTDNHSLPVNQTTKYLQQDSMNDRTMSGVEQSILNDRQIPFSVAASKDENFAKTLSWLQGRNEAKSLIDSGNKFKIDGRMADLDTRIIKTPSEEMEYKYLKQYQQRLLHGDSQALMAETPMGSQIVQSFNDRLNAIKVGGYNPGESQKLTRDAYNNFVDNSIAYWDAQHVDPRLNQPIPPEIVAPMAQAFQPGGDANVALERLGYLDKYSSKAYAARAMPDPISRETMQTIALADNSVGVRPEWKRSLIEAQQPMVLKEMTLEKGDVSKIRTELATEMSDIMTYLSIGTTKDDPRSQAFLDMATNKVMYDGIKKGDLSLSNRDAYIKDFVDNARLAYNVTSGLTNTANLNQLGISQTDWGYISRHEQNEVYKTLYQITSKSEIEAAVDRNPLVTVLTPTNHVVVMDSYGNVLSNHPYSDKLRMKSVRDLSAEDTETIKRQKEQGSLGDINPIRYGY